GQATIGHERAGDAGFEAATEAVGKMLGLAPRRPSYRIQAAYAHRLGLASGREGASADAAATELSVAVSRYPNSASYRFEEAYALQQAATPLTTAGHAEWLKRLLSLNQTGIPSQDWSAVATESRRDCAAVRRGAVQAV
ncbi:MAG TPA: hypothetical protein VNC50_09970, partial [Planctomycetia bacterium]|nr:hypothetical protein [Planctomycetia bacterium]